MHLQSVSTVPVTRTQSSDVSTFAVLGAKSLVSDQPSLPELPGGRLSQRLLSIKAQAAPEDTLASEGRPPCLRGPRGSTAPQRMQAP